MADIKLEDLEKAQKKASEKAIKVNKALGLEYLTVKKGTLISVSAGGEEKVLRKAKFSSRKVDYSSFTIKHVD